MNGLKLGFFAIPVLDMNLAKTFFASVMAWEFNDRDPGFSYIMAGGEMIGALEVASETLKPSASGPLMYFRADNMKKTLSRVNAGGGKVIEKLAMEGGSRGFTARISDPFGNTVGFWASED